MNPRPFFTLSENLAEGFRTLYDEGINDEPFEAFASRWGGLDLATFERVLAVGEGEDLVLAILVVGATATPQAANALLPFLARGPRMPRWASALALGKMQEARAFPLLEALLLNGLSLHERAQATTDEELSDELCWCMERYPQVVEFLETWQSPTLVATLRQAFHALWAVEQAYDLFYFEWRNYDALAYALGAHGDFGVLDGLSLPAPHRKAAQVFLALGTLEAKRLIPDGNLMTTMLLNERLQQEVAAVLATRFGLSPQEQRECVEQFYDSVHQRSSVWQGEQHTTRRGREESEVEEETEEEEGDYVVPDTLCVYRAHSGRVHTLAWSPQGDVLVTGGADGVVRLWQATTGETLMTLRGPSQSVNVVAWSPQGHLIAAAGNEGTVWVWRVDTGELVRVYRGHHGWIWRGLAFSPDGKRLVSASWDHRVQVWEATSGRCLLTYQGHPGIVCSLAWSPDGRWIASGGGYPDCSIQVWDAGSGELVTRDLGHQRDVDQQRPVPASVDAYDEAWLRGPSSVHSLLWSPDGSRLASAGLRYVCRIWEVASGRTLVASDRTCGPLSWSPNGAWLISPNFNRVEQWDASTNRLRCIYDPRGAGAIEAIAWSPDGTHIAASGEDGVRVWLVEGDGS